jgi:hypothetical protein
LSMMWSPKPTASSATHEDTAAPKHVLYRSHLARCLGARKTKAKPIQSEIIVQKSKPIFLTGLHK